MLLLLRLGLRAGEVAGLRLDDIDREAATSLIGAYHALYEVERSLRMTKSDLRARPIFHQTRDAIQAHLTIVFAALASPVTSNTRSESQSNGS